MRVTVKQFLAKTLQFLNFFLKTALFSVQNSVQKQEKRARFVIGCELLQIAYFFFFAFSACLIIAKEP